MYTIIMFPPTNVPRNLYVCSQGKNTYTPITQIKSPGAPCIDASVGLKITKDTKIPKTGLGLSIIWQILNVYK